MNISNEKLRDLLVKPGLIAPERFLMIEKEAGTSGKRVDQLLIDKDIIKDDQLGRLIAAEFGYLFVSLREEKIDSEVLSVIPESMARAKEVIVFGRDARGTKVATSDPKDIITLHMLEKKIGGKIIVYYATPADIHEALTQYRTGLREEFNKHMAILQDVSLSREERDDAVVHIVNVLLQYGYESKASDIHIEPYPQKTMVRFRIDGVMHDVLEIPKDLLESILTRIKVLSKMRTDEHRAAQDGKLVFESGDEKADVRVSVVPVTGGENIVMRILSAKNREMSLTDLGLSETDLGRVDRSLDNPHGMILVTGPTGSGKTTTVYGMLKVLNTREVHISTIEDPVEYEIEGISQIQVNSRTNLTFAKGLRAIVRQDPDIIMVGEIRDQETAEIAVNSAMTGHLVLSTLHANDAATTLPRLLDMGIEPFLVASTVNIIIAQRLVRKICEKCRTSHAVTKEEKALIESNSHLQDILKSKQIKVVSKTRFYHGAGCRVCNMTGYIGRIGIFEALLMSEGIKELVTRRTPSGEIMSLARTEGMTTMMEDGVEKVIRGITTLDEILRATME